MMYCVLRLAAWVVLLKCVAAASASAASCAGDAAPGEAALVSSHTPASTPLVE